MQNDIFCGLEAKGKRRSDFEIRVAVTSIYFFWRNSDLYFELIQWVVWFSVLGSEEKIKKRKRTATEEIALFFSIDTWTIRFQINFVLRLNSCKIKRECSVLPSSSEITWEIDRKTIVIPSLLDYWESDGRPLTHRRRIRRRAHRRLQWARHFVGCGRALERIEDERRGHQVLLKRGRGLGIVLSVWSLFIPHIRKGVFPPSQSNFWNPLKRVSGLIDKKRGRSSHWPSHSAARWRASCGSAPSRRGGPCDLSCREIVEICRQI